MSVTIDELGNVFRKWMEAFKSKHLKVSLIIIIIISDGQWRYYKGWLA